MTPQTAAQINNPQTGQVETVPNAEIVALKAQLEAANAAGAEMRDVLLNLPKTGAAYTHALSTDCGQGWRSPQEWEELQAKCAEMRLALERVNQCPTEHISPYGPCCCQTVVTHALSNDCGKDFLPRSDRKPCYCLGLHTIDEVSKNGQLQTEAVDFVAADDLFHNNPFDRPTKEQLDKLREQVKPLVEAIRLFVEWCKTPEQVVTPEVIEAQHEAYAIAKSLDS